MYGRSRERLARLRVLGQQVLDHSPWNEVRKPKYECSTSERREAGVTKCGTVVSLCEPN